MNKSFCSALRYGLLCIVLLGVSWLLPAGYTEKFYRFDRSHVFVPMFFFSLLLVGILFRSYDAVTWRKVLLKGAFVGVVAGLIAYFVTILVNRHGATAFGSAKASEVVVSALFTLVVFFTPVWGATSALIARAMAVRACTD